MPAVQLAVQPAVPVGHSEVALLAPPARSLALELALLHGGSKQVVVQGEFSVQTSNTLKR